MKVPQRLFLHCRASELTDRVRLVAEARAARQAETACLAGMSLLLLAAFWLG